MDQLVPRRDLCEEIKPFYTKTKSAGRRPAGVERMLRIHFIQHWFYLSASSMEEASYD